MDERANKQADGLVTAVGFCVQARSTRITVTERYLAAHLNSST